MLSSRIFSIRSRLSFAPLNVLTFELFTILPQEEVNCIFTIVRDICTLVMHANGAANQARNDLSLKAINPSFSVGSPSTSYTMTTSSFNELMAQQSAMQKTLRDARSYFHCTTSSTSGSSLPLFLFFDKGISRQTLTGTSNSQLPTMDAVDASIAALPTDSREATLRLPKPATAPSRGQTQPLLSVSGTNYGRSMAAFCRPRRYLPVLRLSASSFSSFSYFRTSTTPITEAVYPASAEQNTTHPSTDPNSNYAHPSSHSSDLLSSSITYSSIQEQICQEKSVLEPTTLTSSRKHSGTSLVARESSAMGWSFNHPLDTTTSPLLRRQQLRFGPPTSTSAGSAICGLRRNTNNR